MNKPRCIYPDRLYEVTIPTRQDRFFFVPIRKLTLLIIGVLAYCQQKHQLGVCAVAFLTNHAHLLVRAESQNHLKQFFCLANSQIAQEVQRMCDWDGGIFKKMEITPVTNEPEAQEARLKYILSQGVKEGLVPHPSKWPGVHFARAILSGSMKMKGIWIERTKLWQRVPSRKRKKGAVRRWLSRKDYEKCVQHLDLELAPLPCWEGLTPKERTLRARELCREIQSENAEIRASVPRDYKKKLTNRNLFTYRPPKEKRRRKNRNAPKVHAATLEEWKVWVDELRDWHAQYQRASQRLRQGVLEAIFEFPKNAFLPTGLIIPQPCKLPPGRAPTSRALGG